MSGRNQVDIKIVGGAKEGKCVRRDLSTPTRQMCAIHLENKTAFVHDAIHLASVDRSSYCFVSDCRKATNHRMTNQANVAINVCVTIELVDDVNQVDDR